MAIRGYVLGVALLAVVGWCMVQESIKQTQARYRLAEISRRENEIRKRLTALMAEEESLRSPARLTALLRESTMHMVMLRTAMPEDAPAARLASARRPGEVLDEDFARRESPVRVATVSGDR